MLYLEAGSKWSTPGAVLGPVLEGTAERILVPFTNDTTGGCIEALQGRATTPEDLEEQADRSLVKLSKDKCEVSHLARRTPHSTTSSCSESASRTVPGEHTASEGIGTPERLGASHGRFNKHSYSGQISSRDHQHPHVNTNLTRKELWRILIGLPNPCTHNRKTNKVRTCFSMYSAF